MKHPGKELSIKQAEELLIVLEARFKKNMRRHPDLEWAKVLARLKVQPAKLWSLQEMERTGGEPDVAAHDPKTGEFIFYDCSAQTPNDRRSLCYDGEALRARKEHKPKNSAAEMAAAMGVEILTESEYRELQRAGELDTKSSSWLKTPPEIRKLGGAIFGDRRFDRVFIYHNGAESYYAGRGFRGALRVWMGEKKERRPRTGQGRRSKSKIRMESGEADFVAFLQGDDRFLPAGGAPFRRHALAAQFAANVQGVDFDDGDFEKFVHRAADFELGGARVGHDGVLIQVGRLAGALFRDADGLDRVEAVHAYSLVRRCSRRSKAPRVKRALSLRKSW